jgi:hypothetical protein
VAPGFAATHVRGIRPGGRNVDIALQRPARIEGQVTLARPSAQVMVSLCRPDEVAGEELCVARRLYQPPEPSFSLEDLPSGRHDLVIDADGHRTARVVVTLSPGQSFTVAPLELVAE